MKNKMKVEKLIKEQQLKKEKKTNKILFSILLLLYLHLLFLTQYIISGAILNVIIAKTFFGIRKFLVIMYA